MNAMPPPAAVPVSAPAPQPQSPAAADAPAKAAPKASPKSPNPKDTPKGPKDTPNNTSKTGASKAPAAAPNDPNAAKNDAESGNDSTADFALALAQTTNAAAQATTAKTAPSKAATADDGSSDPELAAMQMGISMQIPQQLPQTPQTNVAMRAGDADEGADLLAAVTQKVGKDMQALLDELASASDRTSGTTGSAKTVDVPQMPSLPVTQADTRQQPSTAAADSPMRPMHTPVGTQAWADELGNRVTLLATQGHQTASLKLSPEHLGPLEVRISIRDDQASVWFGAAHADTRAAIEHALPKLREQFASQGLSLADAGVFREPPRDNSRRAPSGNGVGALQDAPAESTLAVVVRRWGLVDAYV